MHLVQALSFTEDFTAVVADSLSIEARRLRGRGEGVGREQEGGSARAREGEREGEQASE